MMIFEQILVVVDFGRECDENLLSLGYSTHSLRAIKPKVYQVWWNPWGAQKKTYQDVLDGEHSTFTLLAFTTNGAMNFETRRFYQPLNETRRQLKWKKTNKNAWVKRKVSFSIPLTSIVCIRDSRSKKHYVPTKQNIDVGTTNNLVSLG